MLTFVLLRIERHLGLLTHENRSLALGAFSSRPQLNVTTRDPDYVTVAACELCGI